MPRTLPRSSRVRAVLLILVAALVLVNPIRKAVDEFLDYKYHAIFQNPPVYDAHHNDRRILKDSNVYTDVTNARNAAQKSAAVAELCKAHHFPPWQRSDRRFYDLTMVSTELDMLEIRLETLSPYVDYFIIVESAKTFTGIPKPLVLRQKENLARFAKFQQQIIYKVIEDEFRYRDDDGSQWDHEIFLRNAMLTHVFPDLEGTDKAAEEGDVILVSDLDELIKPETALVLRHCDFPKRLTMHGTFSYYSYSWRHRGADWNHPQATTYGGSVETTIMPEALRKELWDPRLVPHAPWRVYSRKEKYERIGQESAHLRDAGWHCSSCFDTIKMVVDKLNGFSHQEYNSKANRDPRTIIDRYKNGLDLFGRPENEWAFDPVPPTDVPEYVLKDKSGRLRYLVDRNTTYAGFIDAEEMIANPPP